MTTVTKDPRDVILSPVVSEKSYGLLDEGKYTFVVDPRANKTEIKIAIEQIFSVKVASAASPAVPMALTALPVCGPATKTSYAPLVKTTSSAMSTS